MGCVSIINYYDFSKQEDSYEKNFQKTASVQRNKSIQ